MYHILYLVIIGLFNVNSQILYQCNFDSATIAENCLTGGLLLQSSTGSFTGQSPDSPFSDVTSLLKPTANGQRCAIPFQIGAYQWDMYFCYSGVCLTAPNVNGTCTLGKFGSIKLATTAIKSFQIRTPSDSGINGMNKQCLIYYYYMSNATQKSITVHKVEVDGEDVVIDRVTSSPYNGWIKQEVTYNAKAPGYKVYFDAAKAVYDTIGTSIAFDEISITQGACNEPLTTSNTMEITSTLTSTLKTSPTTMTILTKTFISSIIYTTDTTDTLSSTKSYDTKTSTVRVSTESPSLKTTTFLTTNSDTSYQKSSSSTTIRTPSTTTTTTTTATTEQTSISTSPTRSTTITTTSRTVPTKTTVTTITQRSSQTSISVTTSRQTSITSALTSVSENSTTIEENLEPTPTNKTLVIVVATVIPVVLIAIVGGIVWMKISSSASSDILGTFSQPFTTLDENEMFSSQIELDSVDETAF
ncbi:hypothetical protein I4U23_006263 [Adineta vaga]|nr:hypothetical protein I4U23_006263 [Adineta vaga]